MMGLQSKKCPISLDGQMDVELSNDLEILFLIHMVLVGSKHFLIALVLVRTGWR